MAFHARLIQSEAANAFVGSHEHDIPEALPILEQLGEDCARWVATGELD